MKTIAIIDEDTLEIKEIKIIDEEESSICDDLNQIIQEAFQCEPQEFYEKYKKYKDAEAEFDALYNPIKLRLLELYKNHPSAPKNIIVGESKLTYVSPSVRNTIDSKKLKEEEPEIAKKFSKNINVSATIRIDDLTKQKGVKNVN